MVLDSGLPLGSLSKITIIWVYSKSECKFLNSNLVFGICINLKVILVVVWDLV